jgi:2-phospho-L-lactate/phosphoenolpyruvate guanylyltransferase
MSIVAVIPIRSFAMGKLRLSPTLDPGVRSRLGQALAEHVATTVRSAGLTTLIITPDPEVTRWADDASLPSMEDPGGGLDNAAAAGTSWAAERGSAWMVLHSDLPWLTGDDLGVLRRPLEQGRSVLAPSSDGGTSAIGGSGPVHFSFGPASFHRHLKALDDPQIVARRGLLLDIDSPGDLIAAMSARRGLWLRDVIPVR